MKRLLLTILTIAAFSCTAEKAEQIAIIPQPVSMKIEKGDFTLNTKTIVTYSADNQEMERAAKVIAKNLGEILGKELQTSTEMSTKNAINIKLISGLNKEGYKLNISTEQISIETGDYNGAIYAMQTIKQLLPQKVYGKNNTKSYLLPAVTIDDYPRFGWRGMMLDCSRHFFNAEEVKKFIDYLAIHKFNRFHWHLTDDQGWRLEIKKYPLLTEKGAWRVDRSGDDWNARKPLQEGEKESYGGFFTQEQVREVIAYAKERGIAVVPEIEIPGHSTAVFAAYPQLSCLSKPQNVTPGGYYPDDLATCYCAGNEEVFTFLEDILSEVIELFPEAPYIHIGGDEVDKQFWRNCTKCSQRMKDEKLNNLDELQSYFIQRVNNIVNSKGKRAIGWDEVLEGGLDKNVVVMSWRGIGGGIEAAKLGNDVIMASASHLYFDYYQNNPDVEPKAFGGYITVKHVYGFEPVPETLTQEQGKHILGVQANLWCEHISTFSHVQYMTLSRMSALSEVAWSPKTSRDWDSFSERLSAHFKRFDAMGLNYHKGADQIDFVTSFDSTRNIFSVKLTTEFYGSDILFTTDDSEPTLTSTRYDKPIEITKSTTVKAIVAKDGKQVSKLMSQRTIGMHKGIGKKIKYNTQPSDAYLGSGNSTLLDGFTGLSNHNDGYMQGFCEKNFDVEIDLEQVEDLKSITLSCFQSVGAWIYLPVEVKFYTSNDATNWTNVATLSVKDDSHQARQAYTVEGNYSCRYVRIVGVNGITPEGLPGAGKANWIFCDEIIIK